jgi:GNAT superfamily N-acetyltransferase
VTLNVSQISKNKGAILREILEGLPDWFGQQDSIDEYCAQAEENPVLVARDGDEIVGALLLKNQTAATDEVLAMGVKQTQHRKGAGRALINAAVAQSRNDGRTLLSVKTLGPSADYEPYARTRRFYLGLGFLPIEELKTLWDEENPCLFMVKVLG